MIKLDGNFGEGGGQIVRTALALSTITQKPFEVDNIRKGRCDSGLKAQHLYCIKALEKLCNAETEGAKLKSNYLKYFPDKIEGKTIAIDIGTAGSITLLLQAVLLPCLFADKKVRLKITGGTEGKWAMPYDYFKEVLVPHIKKFCESIEISLMKRGYYPKGGGKVDITIRPKYSLNEFDSFEEFLDDLKENVNINLIEQGELLQIRGISHTSLSLEKAKVAERQAKAAKVILNKLNCPVRIDVQYSDTFSTGSGITLWAVFSNSVIGADCLGERGKRAESVGEKAAKNLIKEVESKAPIDSHLGDQILPLMALVTPSKINVSGITNHAKTNMYVIEKFLPVKFKINEIIECSTL